MCDPIERIQALGWVVECESPLELRHPDGSFASGVAARVLLAHLDDLVEAARPVSEGGEVFKELVAIHNQMAHTIAVASSAIAHIISGGDSALEPDEHWELVYSEVFSAHGSRRVVKLLEQLNTTLEWYDPDASYEEDVRAYHSALTTKVKLLARLFPR